MLDLTVTVLVSLLGLHAFAKFAFFALPYARRRAAVDKQYGAAEYAGRIADPVLMVFTVIVAALVVWRGIDGVSFLAALWIGATLIELFFHQYHRRPSPDRAAPEPTSPLKQMSYAIQDAPAKAWPQMVVMSVLVAVGFVAIAVGGC